MLQHTNFLHSVRIWVISSSRGLFRTVYSNSNDEGGEKGNLYFSASTSLFCVGQQRHNLKLPLSCRPKINSLKSTWKQLPTTQTRVRALSVCTALRRKSTWAIRGATRWSQHLGPPREFCIPTWQKAWMAPMAQSEGSQLLDPIPHGKTCYAMSAQLWAESMFKLLVRCKYEINRYKPLFLVFTGFLDTISERGR